MDAQHKEYEKMKNEIHKEIELLFKANMKIFDWDIPENDDRESARLIITAIEEAVDKLKRDVEAGKYDNY
ncbi:hypothetical protein [Hydrogenimonas urashimensis]|uniref:hypothetical protein n=1 Tax=Hydrogenimonas urashimensis TaxID=2740515 RepID=UPI001915E8B7|nr:hypothetical protein [Hydrogenimonas urashimensis]